MKSFAAFIVIIVLIVLGVWFFWQWGVCRFYVDPDYMAVITAKIGHDLPAGEILAKTGQKGVQEDVLGEGRHFLNPFFYEHKIMPVTIIPPGKVGVVTAKVGKNLPDGEFLANPGEKGIWRTVLGPGKYRMNPVGYQLDLVDAISVPIGYAGVITSLSGKQALEGDFAGPGQKGVRHDILQPGLYYVNPRELSVTVLEIGVNQVSLLGKLGTEIITKAQIVTQNRAMQELDANVLMDQQEKRADYFGRSSSMAKAAPSKPIDKKDYPGGSKAKDRSEISSTFVINQFVEFPSRDGFEISLDMTVEFELLPQNLAWIYRSYGDLPAAVDKIIMPQILSISRLKGSAYGARDFIVGEGREKFQNDLTESLAKTLIEKRIVIHSALIRHVNVPMQILDPIQQASIAQEQDLTNKEKQNTARKQAELNTELSLIDQRREQVAQETEKIKAEVKADQEKQVAETRGETLKQVAQIEKQTATVRAEKTTTLGKAEADVVRLVQGEVAKGFQLRINAFKDPTAYNLWNFANSLRDDLKVSILHAGPGTLWTDLEKARMGDLAPALLKKE
ncbi:MAG: SPFH domain-containing protein [Lentisphaerota bacterium]